VSPSGEAVISIALNSVQTNVDTRDERMKKLVFKTADYPLATISTSLPMATLGLDHACRPCVFFIAL